MTMPAMSDECRADIRAARVQNKVVLYRGVQQLNPQACPNCGGSGSLWFQFAVAGPYQTPPGLGQAIAWVAEGGQARPGWYKVESKCYPCPVCGEHGERLRYLWRSSGLEVNEREWRLDFLEGLPAKDGALCEARAMLAEVPRPKGWLSLSGPYGVGKSGVLKSLVAACVRASVQARYVRAGDILAEIRASYGDDSLLSEDEITRRYGMLPMLAIDEVDSIGSTDWSQSTLKLILDTRYRKIEIAATALASNLDPEAMPERLGYLASRMRDGARVRMGGQDLRG